MNVDQSMTYEGHNEGILKCIINDVIDACSKYEFSLQHEPKIGDIIFSHVYDDGRKEEVVYRGDELYELQWTIPHIIVEIDLSDSNIESSVGDEI